MPHGNNPEGSSSLPNSVREHVALMSRGSRAITGIGGVTGAYGIYELVEGAGRQSGWVWLAVGFAVLFLAQIHAVQAAIRQRDAARGAARSVTQQVASIESSDRTEISNVRMTIGDSTAGLRRRPRRRWWPRVLEDEQRIDLANRCEACAAEMLAWLHRPEPRPDVTGLDSNERWQEERRVGDEHRAETVRVFHTQFTARARDLLNECAEAGYALDPALEEIRVEGEIHWYQREPLAEGLAIAGRRVRRRSKRL